MPGLAGEVANLVVALKLDDSGFSGRLNAAARQLKAMDTGLSQVGHGVGQVGTGLGKLATVGTVAAVGGLTAVITTAASMEQAFTGVEKTVDASAVQLEELRSQIRLMSSETGTAFEDLARIGEAGGALGIPTEDLDDFIDIVNRLAVSTDLGVEGAATALGHLRTILHLSADEMRETADAVVALGNDGASTEPEIIGMAERFAAAGRQAGLSTSQILGLASAVSSMGVEVESGGSSLSRLFNQTTTNIAVANDEAVAFADALGLGFDEFKRSWDRDALGTFQDLLRHLSEVDKFEQASILDAIGINNVRDINAIQLMADGYATVADQIEVAEEATGALNTESDKFFGTGAQGFKRLKENIRLTADTIGTELLPVTNDLISDFIAELQKPESQEAIKTFAENLAEGVRDFVDEAQKIDWGPILSGLEMAGTVAKGVLDLFKSLPGPLQGLIVGGLALNKVSGGALSDIFKGVGNIALGGAKTVFGNRGSTPANPVFVKDVGLPTGPSGPDIDPTPGPGRRGFSLLDVVKTAVAGFAGFELGYAIAGPEFERQQEAGRSFMEGRVQEIIDSQDTDRIRDGVRALDAELAKWAEKPPQVRVALQGVIDEIQAQRDRLAALLPPGSVPTPGLPPVVPGTPHPDPRGRAAAASAQAAASFDVVNLRRAIDGARVMLPDTAMRPVTAEIGRMTGELSPIRSAAQQQLAAQYAALSAARDTTGAVRGVQGTLAAKDFSPNIIVPVSVQFGVTMYQQTVARQSAARRGSDLSGGV